MTIDERLQALAQTVELISLNMLTLEKHMITLVENNNRLSNILIAHDADIEEHAKRLDKLEGGDARP